jgi:uncharacterized SAM-binding protein YcdF (DUF218 family)
MSLLATSFVTLYLFSTPKVADVLFASSEHYPARLSGTAVARDIGAIVVLGGGRNANAPEYGGETVAFPSLVRLRYGARLERETGLPLLVSGGRVFGTEPASEAALMRDVLENELHVPVRWLEERSRNTAENASYSAELLHEQGIGAIILVTDAAHMTRAATAFENQGLRVVAASTGYRTGHRRVASVLDWLPSANALESSALALHEYLGRLWYAIRYEPVLFFSAAQFHRRTQFPAGERRVVFLAHRAVFRRAHQRAIPGPCDDGVAAIQGAARADGVHGAHHAGEPRAPGEQIAAACVVQAL